MDLRSHYTFAYVVDSKPSFYSVLAFSEEEAAEQVEEALKRIFGKKPENLKLIQKIQY